MFDRPVARRFLFLVGRDGVYVRGIGREKGRPATTRFANHLVQEKHRPLGSPVLDYRADRIDPLLGFGCIDVFQRIHGVFSLCVPLALLQLRHLTTTTGTVACSSVLCATDPTTAPVCEPRPRVPITISEAPCWAA